MDHYQFWLLDEADERKQGLDLPCEAEPEAWLVADRLLAECRSVEIWCERELIGRIGAAPLAVIDDLEFVWPSKPTGRRSRVSGKAKPARQSGSVRKGRKRA